MKRLVRRISNPFTGCNAAAGTAAWADVYCTPMRKRSPKGNSLDPHDKRPTKAAGTINKGMGSRKCTKVTW
jgi:hypothetical protein